MSEELDVLKLVTHCLNEAKLPYMISGSIALNYYSIPRMTRDIDVVVELKHSDLDNFCKTFREKFYLDEEMIKEEIRRKGMFNLIHKEFFVKIDFIIRKDSDFKETEFSRKRKIHIEDSPMWIVSPEDLIISKLDWAKDSRSEMQLKDIQNLIRTVQSLDWDYIDTWIRKLELEDIYKEAKP